MNKHRKGTDLRESDNLPAKPPELLQKIKWLFIHGRKHLPYVIAGTVVVVAGATWGLMSHFLPNLEVTEPTKKLTHESLGKIGVHPRQSGPLIVVFRDGTEAEVELTIHFQLTAEKASWVSLQYGSQENVERQLVSAIMGRLLGELEKLTLEEVRQSRIELSEKIVREFQEEAQGIFGYVVHRLIIGQIRHRG